MRALSAGEREGLPLVQRAFGARNLPLMLGPMGTK